MLKYLLMLLIKKKKIKTIKKKPNLEFKKKEKGKEIENIISAIKSIIDFSRKNNKLLT